MDEQAAKKMLIEYYNDMSEEYREIMIDVVSSIHMNYKYYRRIQRTQIIDIKKQCTSTLK